MLFKKLGLKTIGYIVALLLAIGFLFFFYKSELLGVYSFSILSIVALALMGLNVLDRFRILEGEAKKLVREGDELFKKGEFKGARDRYEESLIYDDSSFGAEMGMGHYHKMQLNWDEAIKHFKSAFENNPSSALARYYIGYCYNKKGDYKMAVTEFEKAISLNDDLLDAYLLLGDIYYKLGEDSRAKEYYEKFLNRNLDENIQKQVQQKLANLQKRLKAKEGESRT